MNLNPYEELSKKINQAGLIYDYAIYGTKHHEVRGLNILKQLGLEKSATKNLSKSNLQEALLEIKAIRDNEKKYDIDLTKKEESLIKKLTKDKLALVNKIPDILGEQAMVFLASSVESFFNSTFKYIFNSNQKTLISEKKSTLSDSEIINSPNKNDILDLMINKRVRSIMDSPYCDWIKYLNDKGIKINVNKILVEFFLIRNCFVHNHSKASASLYETTKKDRYKIGKEIKISKRNIIRFIKEIRKDTAIIWKAVSTKFPKNT